MSAPEPESNHALLKKLRVDQVARWLEIHPFEVIRTLVRANALPDDLRLDTQDVERVRERGGLESWWDSSGPPVSDADLVRSLIDKLLTRLPDGVASTRSDNLFRGLDGHRQIFLRRVVNQLVRTGYLDIVMTASGLSVSLRTGSRVALGTLATSPADLLALVERCLVDAGVPG